MKVVIAPNQAYYIEEQGLPHNNDKQSTGLSAEAPTEVPPAATSRAPSPGDKPVEKRLRDAVTMAIEKPHGAGLTEARELYLELSSMASSTAKSLCGELAIAFEIGRASCRERV